MKKLIVPLLALMALASCEKSTEDEVEPVNPNNQVEIKLNAKVLNVQTKAIVNQGEAFNPTILASKTSQNYANPDFSDNAQVAVGGAITFTTTHYYPTNGDAIYMIGYHPQLAATDGKVSFTIDGETDIMLSNEVNGSKSTTTPLIMTFEHQLSQIIFKVKGGTGIDDMTVTKITMKSISTKADLTLSTSSFTYGTPLDKDVTIGSQVALTTTAADAGMMLVEPKASYTIDIETDKGNFAGVEIKPATGGFTASSSHTITLTFSGKEVSSTATAGEWQPGSEGGATVE